MAWHLARSLETLRSQVNAAFPLRNKQNDGTIGDADHAARASHHNPNDADAVTAMDITHDPDGGVDAGQLAETLRLNRDPRINNVIFNGRIFSSTQSPWVWRPRNRGPNDHTEHVHIAVGRGTEGKATNPELYDDPAPWAIRALPGTIPAQPAPAAGFFANIKATVFNDGIRPGTETAYKFPMPADFMGYSLPGRITGELPLRITNRATRLSAIGNKADIGPWYDGTAARGPEDRWWENGTRPRAETDPRTNGAGIDLYPALARAIGIQVVERDGRIVAGEAQVDVEIISETPPMAESNTDRLLGILIERIDALTRVVNFGREDEQPVDDPPKKPPVDKPPVVITPPVAQTDPIRNPVNFGTLITSLLAMIVAPATGVSESVDKGTLGSLIPVASAVASGFGLPGWLLPIAGRLIGRLTGATK